MRSRLTRQRGVALISVLLIVAILLAVATRLMASHTLVIKQHQNTFEQDQALQYALGAEALARQALFEDFGSTGKVDNLGEIWAQPVLPFELDEGGFLEAHVRDLNGCFNLNTLVGAEAAANLERLKQMLRNLGVPEALAEGWKDWIDSDQEVTGFGAEDSEYLISEIPHRTPNVVVLNTSELSLLQNVEREHLQLILPHVCLLPDTDTLININTADVQTLAALDKGLTLDTAQPIAASERSYGEVAEFVQEYPDFAPAQSALSVSSHYFEMHAIAQVGTSSVSLLSLLRRDSSTGEVTVLQRDFGKLFRSNVQVETTSE